MREVIDIFISFTMFFIAMIIYIGRLLFTDDVPYIITNNELKDGLMVMLIFTIIYCAYIIWTKHYIFNLALICLPTNLLLMALVQSVRYGRLHKFDKIFVLVGFISLFLVQLLCAFKTYRCYRRLRSWNINHRNEK